MDGRNRYEASDLFRRTWHQENRPTTSEYLQNCNSFLEVKTALAKTFQELSHMMTSLSKDRNRSDVNKQNAVQTSLTNCQKTLVRSNEAMDEFLKDYHSFVFELMEYVSSMEIFSEKTTMEQIDIGTLEVKYISYYSSMLNYCFFYSY